MPKDNRLFTLSLTDNNKGVLREDHPADGEIIYTADNNIARSRIHIIPRRTPESAVVHIQVEVKSREPLDFVLTRPLGSEVTGLSVTFSGTSTMDFHDGAPWRYRSGHCSLTATPGKGHSDWKIATGEIYESIAFTYSREERLATFNDVQLPPELAGLAGEHIESRIFWQIPTQSQFLRIAMEAIGNPYRGAAKQFYLESKALEMLSAMVSLVDRSPSETEKPVTQREMALMREVRDTLQTRYDNPPSLLELAAQAGMNHNKLNHKFRQAFGTTVGCYLQDYRLEQGRAMIAAGQGVKETALILGYRHPGNFSFAYRKKYGSAPGAKKKSTA